jgi:hypothetical protein
MVLESVMVLCHADEIFAQISHGDGSDPRVAVWRGGNTMLSSVDVRRAESVSSLRFPHLDVRRRQSYVVGISVKDAVENVYMVYRQLTWRVVGSIVTMGKEPTTTWMHDPPTPDKQPERFSMTNNPDAVASVAEAPKTGSLHDFHRDVVRLSVNLVSDVADTLKSLSAAQGITVTEGVRRAIALWSLIYSERAKGHKVMIVEGEGDKAKFRELILL